MNGSLQTNSANTPSNGHDARHLIDLFRTLADPIRLHIVRLMESQPQPNGSANGGGGGGLSVGELAEILKLPQSTVSRHLKTLLESNLADTRRDGTSTYYRLSEAASHNASKQLRLLARTHLDRDPVAKNDTHRLTSILRKRETAKAGGSGDFFGKHAPQWDHLRAQWFGDTFHLEGLLALLNPHWTVADIGAGTGAMLPILAPHVKQIIAVDPSTPMLKGARNRVRELDLDNVDIRQGSIEQLPIDKSTVDVALLALVLAYTDDPEAALKEVRRILKPGGIVLIIDLQPHSVELFREKLNHRHMGFGQEQLTAWLTETSFTHTRWHPLAPHKHRAKESPQKSATPIPDLFALRAEAA